MESEQKTLSGITFKINRKIEKGFIIKNIQFTDNGKKFEFTEKVKALKLSDFIKLLNFAKLEITNIFGDYKLNEYEPVDSDRLITDLKNEMSLICLLIYLRIQLVYNEKVCNNRKPFSGTGKTSILNHLKIKEDYNCIDEISRKIIESEQIAFIDGRDIRGKTFLFFEN